ncbi:hypothetical protein AAE02nite_47190 [Adhaeribacter aerolatus]|uniref:SWIM-type domain-containing protein n=1 Tax=Adhaeribacter aerolatus TaxID=670289 RepID=A0A512B4Z4_9BACT|nr:SWIM zinc finger family protein [Adhaeribacter aerolatus]GEO07055.1 hypothetical protein AAE02nite_47190 [Adhaeribacter aerolatus]
MLTLQNFETQIDAAILQRGKQYYSNKAITWLEETAPNTWEAEVEGTDTYQVTVTLASQDEITEISCSCPYDGRICKHAVAVFLALQKEVKKAKSQKAKTSASKNVFEKLLQNISQSEYQEFIRRYAAKDKNFKTEFELYFAEKDDRIDVGRKYEDLMKKLIRKYTDRGFIHYRATYGLAKEADKILAGGEEFIRKNNFRDAFALARVVLKALMEASTNSDDSNGNIGSTIYQAVQLIQNIAGAGQAAPELKESIFIFLKTELDNPVYFNYGDYGYDLFDLFQMLALQLNHPAEFLTFIDTQLRRLTGEYESYQKEYFLKRKIDFLEATGKTKEAADLVQQNLDIVSVRQGEVNKAIAEQKYIAAKNLINGGIQVAERKDHPGTVAAWQKELLRIAVLEKDTETLRRLARHFAFDRGFTLEYYKLWKETFTSAEWPNEIEKYIREIEAKINHEWKINKGKYWQPAHPPLLYQLGPVFIQEGYWDRLLALVQQENNLETTFSYHNYLAPRYPAELLEIYLPALEQYGNKASDRRDYADLAARMKQVMKDIPAGKEKIIKLTQYLKEKYPRRPAMQEELNKILK